MTTTSNQNGNGPFGTLLKRISSGVFKLPSAEDTASFIELASRHYLGRDLTPSERDIYLQSAARGVSFEQLAHDIQRDAVLQSSFSAPVESSRGTMAVPKDIIRDL